MTRGRGRPQLANSAQGAGRPRITTPSQNRKKGRGWHTNRTSWRAILVSHLAILCRDPNRFGPAIATRGGLPTTTRIQSEAQDRVTGSFSNGRVVTTRGWIQPPDKPVSVHTVRFNRPLQPTFLRARAACFPRFRVVIVGTKAVIQNSRTVGGKQQATFAGYFDRLDWFIDAIRHAKTSIRSLYKPSTFHRIEAVRRRASSNYNASRYTTGLNPSGCNCARTTRTGRRRPRITTRVVTPRGWHHDSDSRRVPNPGLAPRQ